MPNLPAHISLAHEAAQRIGHSALETNMSYFLLGSTSPDLRVITRRGREAYHFAPLTFEDVGHGVRGLFDSNPHLSSSRERDDRTSAFVAGYITHLVADERWIVDMYRPYFANREVFEDEVHGKLMDRALQLEMDRRSIDATMAALPLVSRATDEIDVGFIPPSTISEWREWVMDHIEGHFSWERLSFMAVRIAGGDPEHRVHAMADEFVRGVPESVERLHSYVPPERLAEYRERAVSDLVRYISDYLP